LWFSDAVSAEDAKMDGDLHVLLVPDRASARFRDKGNRQSGGMVVEIMAGQKLPPPSVGERIAVFRSWVYDTNHHWSEIHLV
jgi:hypothetical protein